MTRHNEHPLDDLVRRAVHVRDEDVANSWSGSDAEQALLQEIIMTPHDQARPATRDGRFAPGGRTVRTAAFAGAVLAAISVGVVALPALSGGDQAFASWTPTRTSSR